MSNKAWYASKGVWGGLVAGAAGIAGVFFGVDFDAASQAELVSSITAIAGAVGGIVAIIGRLTAKTTIGK